MERFFKDSRTIQRFRSGPLGPYIQQLAEELTIQGFARCDSRLRLFEKSFHDCPGIRETHIEIPVIGCKHVKVGLYQLAAPAFEPKQSGIYTGRSGDVVRHRRQILRNPNHRIRVFGTVHGFHPLALRVPSGQPGTAIDSSRRLQFRIFEEVQRKLQRARIPAVGICPSGGRRLCRYRGSPRIAVPPLSLQ